MKLHTQVKDYSSLKLFDLRSESGLRVACCIRSCISVIFQVRVVLTRNVVVVDRRFDNLSGGHPV